MWPRLARRQEHLVKKRTRLVALKESAMESLQRGRGHGFLTVTGATDLALIRTFDRPYHDFRCSECAISPGRWTCYMPLKIGQIGGSVRLRASDEAIIFCHPSGAFFSP